MVEALLACIDGLVSVGKVWALEESEAEKIVRVSEELLMVSERYAVCRSNDLVYALCSSGLYHLMPLYICTSTSNYRKFGHGDMNHLI